MAETPEYTLSREEEQVVDNHFDNIRIPGFGNSDSENEHLARMSTDEEGMLEEAWNIIEANWPHLLNEDGDDFTPEGQPVAKAIAEYLMAAADNSYEREYEPDWDSMRGGRDYY